MCGIACLCTGSLSVAHSVAEWVNGNSFQAGSSALIKIILKDKYQNILNSTVSSQTALFKAAMYAIRESQIYVQANYTAMSGLGYEILKFVPHDTGKFKIWVGKDNISISNSPLDFSVISGKYPPCVSFFMINHTYMLGRLKT